MTISRWLAGAGLMAFGALHAPASAQAVTLLNAACSSPPVLHCPDKACPAAVTSSPGNVMDRKTGRQYFLDYPCDLKPNEKVTFVLNLHGGGSIENWQRHYFPIVDYKEKYRLVIATPYGPGGIWQGERDDPHLRNIVEQVEGAVGKDNIKAFWLAGHSFGGQTSNRLIMNDAFFTERVDGWVSLSGGRLGSKREEVRATIPRGTPPPPAATPPAATPGATPPAGGPPAGGLAADASVLPAKPFSFIYEAGEHEWAAAGVPKESKWAQKLGCKAQASPREITDVKAGYVFDSRPQENRNKIWGMDPRPGTAKIWAYPDCADGRVVADISRLDKGHTEGLEPKITEEIVKMMLSAK
ncbi:MAG: alpha/beta hydrolase [Hyphomonadaceae bacterium]|nr:alpha/beta hydrolase [Hyphomonadaceae bacterium]